MLEFLNIWIILYYFIKNNEKNLLSKNKFNSILYLYIHHPKNNNT